MGAVFFISAVAGRYNSIIERFRLISAAVAAGTRGVSPVATEQHPNMHFVGVPFEPPEKSADSVPTIVVVIFLPVIGPSFTFDDKVLVRFGQFLERNVDVDVFAGAGPQQILLRFAEFLAAKDPHHALTNGKTSVRKRFVQVDRYGSPKTAAFRTSA